LVGAKTVNKKKVPAKTAPFIVTEFDPELDSHRKLAGVVLVYRIDRMAMRVDLTEQPNILWLI
jgi:hypothetical protein